MPTPQNIRAQRESLLLELDWDDGIHHAIPFFFVRENCQCAACVDENTGRRILDPATLPADVQPVAMSLTGNYALKVKWSDGHDTGLFTWEHLRELGQRGAESD